MIKHLNIFSHLIETSAARDFMGIDPYDFASGRLKLPSSLLSKVSFLNKISPVDFRGVLGIEKSHNSKSNALFLQALALSDSDEFSSEIQYLKNWLFENSSAEFEEYSLGFAFEMALSRYASGPGKTSLIISLFAMFAFFELYKRGGNDEVLDYIKSFENLLSNKWLKFENDDSLWYSYLPSQKDEVYNATAKVGKFYALYFEIFPSELVRVRIKKILNYLSKVQNEDGSWGYSVKNPYVDNFHTAFVLESIHLMHQVVDTSESQAMYKLGLSDYRINCFSGDRPMHFHKLHYPRDVRSRLIDTEIRDIANAVILFSKIGEIEYAERILNWAISSFYDSKGGYFYFFENRFFKSKINYVRWQAWMALAISEFLKNSER
jgi:hypothetical protein